MHPAERQGTEPDECVNHVPRLGRIAVALFVDDDLADVVGADLVERCGRGEGGETDSAAGCRKAGNTRYSR